MKPERPKKRMSLYACRKLLPFFNTGKYILFLAAIFFQQPETVHPFFISIALMFMFLTTDTYLKLSVWKCPCCHKQLPHDFYSRKTMTVCPYCGAELNFSDRRFFVPEEAYVDEQDALNPVKNENA